MASCFSHNSDNMIRPGDFVETILSTTKDERRDISQRPPSVLQGATRPRRSNSVGGNTTSTRPAAADHPINHPNSSYSHGLRVASSSTPPLPTTKGSHHPTTTQQPHSLASLPPSHGGNASSMDVSSVDSWWQSLTRGTWLEGTVELLYTGVVLSVDPVQRTATITVWKKGEKFLADQPRKPVETFPLWRLRKLSHKEFNTTCRKRFMHEAGHYLQLRGEGYDETAPFSLLAHNNKVISELMEKIDTTAKMSLKDLKRTRPRGPGDLLKQPIPLIVPVEDPLANARAELRSTGLVRRRHGDRAADREGTKDASSTITSERYVTSRAASAGPSGPSASTTLTGGHPPVPLYRSGVEAAVDHEKSTVLNQMQFNNATHSSMGAARGPTVILPESAFPKPSSTGNGTKAFLSEVETVDAAMIPCSIVDLRAHGVFVVRPSRTNDPPFLARLPNIEVWDHPKALSRLQSLKRLEVRVLPLRRASDGLSICEIETTLGEPLDERLVAEGLATVTVSALDDPSLVRGAVGPRRLASLRAAQDDAAQAKRGVWGTLALQQGSMALLDPALLSAVGVSQGVGGGGEEAEHQVHLPSLFHAFESSAAFRNKVIEAQLS